MNDTDKVKEYYNKGQDVYTLINIANYDGEVLIDAEFLEVPKTIGFYQWLAAFEYKVFEVFKIDIIDICDYIKPYHKNELVYIEFRQPAEILKILAGGIK